MKLGIVLQSNKSPHLPAGYSGRCGDKPEHAWNILCLELRGKSESKVCPVSTMSDLLKMVESSDKVLVFG